MRAVYREKQKVLKEEYSSLKHEELKMRNVADEKEREGKRYHNLGEDDLNFLILIQIGLQCLFWLCCVPHLIFFFLRNRTFALSVLK